MGTRSFFFVLQRGEMEMKVTLELQGKWTQKLAKLVFKLT